MRTGKYDVGTLHETRNYGQLEVVEYIDVQHRKVKFTSTGFQTITTVNSIRTGCVKDRYKPSLYGVGYLGEPFDHPLRKMLYGRWKAMLNRVYWAKTGKQVAEEWHCFATFVSDVLQLPGVELLNTHSKVNIIDLDSDIIPNEIGIEPRYSKETCQWVTRSENCKTRDYPNSITIRPIGTVIESRHGPVTIIRKAGRKWLIRFMDGTEKWDWGDNIVRGIFGRPDLSEQ